jgi:uncharacterized protein (DUF927 family)
MNISVTYDETDVAKALSKIIKDPNAEEFVKLLSPMICTSQYGTEHFFKLMIGNKLPDIIPSGTLCKMSISNVGYGVDKELTRQEFADADDKIIVTVREFRGYHEYSQYVVEYVAAIGNGTNKRDTTYIRGTELEVIEEF